MSTTTREIKFRAWDKSGKKLVNFTLNDLLDLQCKVETESLGIRDEASNRMYETVMQYTGLKDKDGREIYEGDILSLPDSEFELVTDYEGPTHAANSIGKIVRGDLGWQIDVPKDLGGDYISGIMYLSKVIDEIGEEGWEVIGNIHENPELIANQPL